MMSGRKDASSPAPDRREAIRQAAFATRHNVPPRSLMFPAFANSLGHKRLFPQCSGEPKRGLLGLMERINHHVLKQLFKKNPAVCFGVSSLASSPLSGCSPPATCWLFDVCEQRFCSACPRDSTRNRTITAHGEEHPIASQGMIYNKIELETRAY